MGVVFTIRIIFNSSYTIMPVNLRLVSDFSLTFVGLVLLLFGFISALSSIQTNATPSLLSIITAVLGFILVAYVFANER